MGQHQGVFEVVRAWPHHQVAAGDADGHIASHHEADAAEHLPLCVGGFRLEDGADVARQFLVVWHTAYLSLKSLDDLLRSRYRLANLGQPAFEEPNLRCIRGQFQRSLVGRA